MRPLFESGPYSRATVIGAGTVSVNVKKLSNIAFTFLDYGLDLVWWGRADITHLVSGDFISCFLSNKSQGSYIFVFNMAIFRNFRDGVCNKRKTKNVLP